MKDYKGNIIEESLTDPNILESVETTILKITREENPSNRWHIHTVKVVKEDIDKLSKFLRPGWYMHFWKNKKVIVVYKSKTFEFDFDDKSAWTSAIHYGLSVGIPEEQLDFQIS
ncbi:hypothetical protein KW783_00880 [Candidatus Parcubacteria bacterium]|nr:hypothetical protein [Candidatus Parcubacteria bacterium]